MPELGANENRRYYDAFAETYERERGQAHRGSYHDLLDELEAEFVRRFASGKDVLEVGCGTGLVLERIARFARSAAGVDISPNMLERARKRHLDVQVGSATALPFEANRFDVACAFKVLAHVREIDVALSEMARVVRPGGHVLAEFYNPWSLRGLVKRWGGPRSIAPGLDEAHVFTRYDSPRMAKSLVPPGCRWVDSRGVRIFIPTARVMRMRGLRDLFRFAERQMCDSPLKALGGFWIAAFEKVAD